MLLSDIHGTSALSYGIEDPSDHRATSADPAEDVWRQVRCYQALEASQLERLGEDRFLVVRYEQLCDDPTSVVRRIGRDVFGFRDPVATIAPLRPRRERTLDAVLFNHLAEKGHEDRP